MRLEEEPAGGCNNAYLAQIIIKLECRGRCGTSTALHVCFLCHCIDQGGPKVRIGIEHFQLNSSQVTSVRSLHTIPVCPVVGFGMLSNQRLHNSRRQKELNWLMSRKNCLNCTRVCHVIFSFFQVVSPKSWATSSQYATQCKKHVQPCV